MKSFPKGRDEWVCFFLLPFKAFVIIAPIAVLLFSLYARGPWYLLDPPGEVQTGYALSILILMLGALIQATVCKRGESSKTLIFIGIGLLILFCPAPSFYLRFMLGAAVDLAVLCYSIVAFLRTKLKGFLLLLLGCALSLVEPVFGLTRSGRGNYGAFRNLVTLIDLSSLAAEVLWAAGIFLIIRHVLNEPRNSARSEATK